MSSPSPPVLCFALVIAAATAGVATAADSDPELDAVLAILEEAREEIRAFGERGGDDGDPEHPGRRWAEELWRYRAEQPGTPAADRATTESIHFLLHADRQAAIDRALAVPADDGAWPTLIDILFEAGTLGGEYGVFAQRARAMLGSESDPDRRAQLLFRLAQADWVGGDLAGAETALVELERSPSGPEWKQLIAAAREEIEAWAGGQGDRSGRQARDLWQRPSQVLEALDLAADDRVADVGSGDGYFTLHLAPGVGSAGRIYAVDIEERPLERVRERAAELGLGQIEAVLGAADDPRLPAGELAAVLVVDTYHEMRSYEAMMTGMAGALQPGGRLVVVDIPGELGKERKEYHERHRIPVELVMQEAAAAGLRLRSFDPDFARQPGGRPFYLVAFEKPE